jgi:hypothetical protein
MALHCDMSVEVSFFFLQDDDMLPDRILHQYDAAKKNGNAVSRMIGYTTF